MTGTLDEVNTQIYLVAHAAVFRRITHGANRGRQTISADVYGLPKSIDMCYGLEGV